MTEAIKKVGANYTNKLYKNDKSGFYYNHYNV